MARHKAAMAAAARLEQASPSQRLVEAALRGDVEAVEACLREETVDVNYVGAVVLRAKCMEAVLREETADEVKIEYQEFKTDVTPLFAAAHSGHIEVVRRLLSAGADVNQELFRGYATTASAREGHCDILDMLLKAGASQAACEDALLEASLFGESEAVELLICSDMARPGSTAHAIVIACSRGFVNVVAALLKNGVDINCMDRVLLRSVKPVLHANVDSTPLIAAIVSRQVSMVKCLLEAGVQTDCLVRCGAWSWDPLSGEELRVGACLGEPYAAAWCAVEYYEASGEILKVLLQHEPYLLEKPHLGRTLLCHAILCGNPKAVGVLLDAGANFNFPLSTKIGHKSYPIHLAAHLGCVEILKQLISHRSNINVKTSAGDTPLMISAKADHADCFLELLIAGADIGLANCSGDTALHYAKRSVFASSVVDMMTKALNARMIINSSDIRVFSPLHFFAESGAAEQLQMILHSSTTDLNKLDGSGFTPLMVAARAGHAETFRLLVMAGADIAVKTPEGKSVMSILLNDDAAKTRDCFQQILLRAMLADVITDKTAFRGLHYAAQKGDASSLVQLLKMGYNVDSLDTYGYSPLMLAAMEGNSDACKILLLQGGADCNLMNDRNETALSLVRRSSKSNKVTEAVLLDQLAWAHVLMGEELLKHIHEGRGSPHIKTVRMLKLGVLTWGRTDRRNVVCKEARAGPSLSFSKNRTIDNEDGKMVIFRVITVTGREVHFEVGSSFSLEMWVRGINLIVKEAVVSGS